MDKSGYHNIEEVFGKKVVDVKGFVTAPFGDLLFAITHLVLEDGTKLGVQGEHDCAYVEESFDYAEKLKTLHAEREAAGL